MVQHLDKPALKKVWFLDAQWSDLPEEIYEEVSSLWRLFELGNDNYIHKTSILQLHELNNEGVEVEKWFNKGQRDDEQWGWINVPFKVDRLIEYLESHELDPNEQIIIHWWW